ncbi:MAG: exodeoxyribonuclease V subunit alpha [Flavobacteriaceae bacterium]|jgi:exodeoxyribonuclease V alpha subunit|nr:exodeoxyribonuclease V subunit alpha [Flavobacteriaceae bacterium]
MYTSFETEIASQFASFFLNDPIYPFVIALYNKMEEGHICLDINDIEQFNTLETSQYVSFQNSDVKPFIIHNKKLYLYKYFIYESHILSFIQTQHQQTDLIQQRIDQLQQLTIDSDLYDSFSDLTPTSTLIDWQFIALIKSFVQGFSIITGGPGTGKTTTIAKLLTLLFQENSNLRIALTAPTGKAAIRMKEALLANKNYEKIKDLLPDPDSKTIHRLLGAIANEHLFKHNDKNKLNYDVVLVDEASMIDIPLMSKLIQALPTTTRLILLGDQNQLSAVGTGSMLKDLCDNVPNLTQISPLIAQLLQNKLAQNQINILVQKEQQSILQNAITQLQISRRFSEDSHIGQLSQAILNYTNPNLIENPLSSYFTPHKAKDFVHIDTAYQESYIDEFITYYEKYINEKDIQQALYHLNNTRILCGVKESEQGVYYLNYKIEMKLVQKGLIKKNTPFYDNRPIMITKNNPELKIYNGDIGIIRNNRVYFGTGAGEITELHPALLTEFETVYAMTIHKSQGSEFDHVLVILPQNTENKILNKQLLYTGVTRAKKKIVIQTSVNVLKQTLNTEVSRISGIPNRLKLL